MPARPWSTAQSRLLLHICGAAVLLSGLILFAAGGRSSDDSLQMTATVAPRAGGIEENPRRPPPVAPTRVRGHFAVRAAGDPVATIGQALALGSAREAATRRPVERFSSDEPGALGRRATKSGDVRRDLLRTTADRWYRVNTAEASMSGE
jgi:hypothetical protein